VLALQLGRDAAHNAGANLGILRQLGGDIAQEWIANSRQGHRPDPRARRVEALPLHLGDDAADDAIAECRTAFELRRDIAKETALRRLGPTLTNY
jgi:hypothetical protein